MGFGNVREGTAWSIPAKMSVKKPATKWQTGSHKNLWFHGPGHWDSTVHRISV
jgi:hypothetical protein